MSRYVREANVRGVLANPADDAGRAEPLGEVVEPTGGFGVIWVDSDVVAEDNETNERGGPVGHDDPADCLTRIVMFFPEFFRSAEAG